MAENIKPGYLGLVRIEDDVVEAPKLPIVDLGRIGVWNEFVKCGGVVNQMWQDAVWSSLPGVALSVDFRFDHDPSGPSKNKNAKDADGPHWDEVFSHVAWSNHLVHKNTGVLLGPSVDGELARRLPDIPIVTALHTLAASHTCHDASTTMLFGQMLRSSGHQFSQDPFVESYREFQSLPDHCESAVKARMHTLRQDLLRRLGAEGQDAQRICLFARSGATARLLIEFSEAADELDLDQRLERFGLEYYTRSGTLLSFDLRSLFMDRLGEEHDDRGWGRLPIELVKGTDDQPGEVLEFIQKIDRTVGNCHEEAARVVRPDEHGRKTKLKACPSMVTRAYALLFAYLEETLAKRDESMAQRQLHWDWVKDEPSSDTNLPTMNDALRAMLEVLPQLHSYYPEKRKYPDGFYPISGRHTEVDGESQEELGLQDSLRSLLEDATTWRPAIEVTQSGREPTMTASPHAAQLSMTKHADTLIRAFQYDRAQLLGLSGETTEDDFEYSPNDLRQSSVDGGLDDAGLAKQLIKARQPDQPIRLTGEPGEQSDIRRARIFERMATRLANMGAIEIQNVDGRCLIEAPFGAPSRSLLPFRVPVQDNNVVRRLGGYEDLDGKVTNHIERILGKVFPANWKNVKQQFANGPLPNHLAMAACWYVENYHPNLPMEQWPPQCISYS